MTKNRQNAIPFGVSVQYMAELLIITDDKQFKFIWQADIRS